MSPVRSLARIPSPESLTPPPSANDVERKIKDAVGLECNVVDNDNIKIISGAFAREARAAEHHG